MISRLIEAKRRSEESRRRIDAQYRLMAETAPDGIVSVNDRAQILSVNPAVAKIFGYTAAELVGQPLTRLLPDFPLETRTAVTPLVGRRKDGTEFSAEVSFGEVVTSDQHIFSGFVRDVSERERAKEALQKSESYLAEAQRLSHTGSFGWNLSSGQIFWSEETYRIVGYDPASQPTLELVLERVHPEDRASVRERLDYASRRGADLDFEHRLLMPDGSVKHVHVLAHAMKAGAGGLEYVGAAMDVTASQLAEEELRKSEEKYRDLVTLASDAIYVIDQHGNIVSTNPAGLELWGGGAEDLKCLPLKETYLPEELDLQHTRLEQLRAGVRLRFERTFLRKDGSGVPVEVSASPMHHGYSQAVVRDISERKRAEMELQRTTMYLAEAQRLSHTGSWVWDVGRPGPVYWSAEMYRIYRRHPALGPPTLKEIRAFHSPGDWNNLTAAIEKLVGEKVDIDCDSRLLFPDGSITYIRIVAHPVVNAAGEVVEFLGTTIDITEQYQARQALRKAFDEIKKSEDQLQTIVDTIPTLAWRVSADGPAEFLNRRWHDYTGLSPEEAHGWGWKVAIHTDDLAALMEKREAGLVSGEPWEIEARLRRFDGEFRWFLFRASPLRDEFGNVVKWYGTNTDIEDHKRAEQALRKAFAEIEALKDELYRENLALKEEVDQASMFEEIVGASGALRRVLSQVAKVAPTDSTVLILGETGTGKELIARAIHKRSSRSTRAFVRVNCAAIPPSLIASELFGHEKGAFTGAIQRRLGRFELADGGTIFLDEIGELPAETQVSLLRVLQEREFERVGGNQSITVDVRVLAATNRDLDSAVDAGVFRQDLFYRLNVFPVEIPSLRERIDDIPLLVEYLIERYAKKVGKKINHIRKKTLDLFQAYDWPGNVRELQNVVERAVVLSDGDTFSVDETWLKREVSNDLPRLTPLGRLDANHEREIIEAALTESGGRISGPLGAACKLGIPRTTLDSKINSLGINKYRFKSR
ncbi:MAG: PAS domain S-box protein [Terriglobales bacterium]